MKLPLNILLFMTVMISSCYQKKGSGDAQALYASVDRSSCGALFKQYPFRWESEPFEGNAGNEFFGVLVRITRAGVVYWNGQPVDRERLSSYAQELSKKDHRVQILLQIEDGAKCEAAYDVAYAITVGKACNARKCLVIPSDEKGPIVS